MSRDALERELELWHAFQASDAGRLESLIHPDARDVGPYGVLDRSALIAAVGRMQIESFEIGDFVVTATPPACIATYRSTIRGTYRGLPFVHPTVIVSSVWLLYEVGWRLVHRAETVPAPDGP